MDAQRALPFLVLVICIINAVFSIHNGRGGPNNIRQVRGISEYLVPPPPPKFHPPGRIPRLANQSANEQGYFSWFLGLLNPFGSSKPSQPPPPLPPQPETSHSSNVVQSVPLPSANYNGPPPPPPPLDYEKPPLPPSTINDHSAPTKPKNCNPCNKSPWLPLFSENLHSLESQRGGYVPEDPHDTYHAASHEVRVSDFSFELPDGYPLPNPHMYPGPLPPLYKAEDFKPSQGTGPDFNGGHNGQSVYPSSDAGVLSQEPGYTNPPFFGGSGVTNSQPSGVSNNEGIYNVQSNTSPGFLDNASQTDQNFPSSYGISDLNRIPSTYDLSSSANVAKDFRVPLHTSEGSGKIESSIVFDESPVIDITHKDESQTHPFSRPSINANIKNVENDETIVVSDDEIFRPRDIAPGAQTFKYLTDLYLTEKSKVNNSATQDTKNLRVIEEQNISPSDKIKYSGSNVFSTTLSGTAREPFRNILKPYDDITEETLIDDDITEETLINDNFDMTSEQNKKKNKQQVQVIIPYTSEYTPLPFNPPHERKNSNTNKANYVGEESKNIITVVRPPNSRDGVSPNFNQPTSSSFSHKDPRKPVDNKANNSIDVQKLQKNIDNWTIQKYSQGTTVATTMSPNQIWNSPYLSPSKAIPAEYFTTTESGRIADSYNDNVKTFTLGGFTFNDHEYKESASHHVEVPRVQVKSTEISTNVPTTSEHDMWRSFPMGISAVSQERVYIVTPQPQTTPRSNPKNREQKVLQVAESNTDESKKAFQTNMKETISNTFESIEKVYQVLPQAVNNLAVASTGPESVPLWGIMEHEHFTSSPTDSEYDIYSELETEHENPDKTRINSRLSKESRARR